MTTCKFCGTNIRYMKRKKAWRSDASFSPFACADNPQGTHELLLPVRLAPLADVIAKASARGEKVLKRPRRKVIAKLIVYDDLSSIYTDYQRVWAFESNDLHFPLMHLHSIIGNHTMEIVGKPATRRKRGNDEPA